METGYIILIVLASAALIGCGALAAMYLRVRNFIRGKKAIHGIAKAFQRRS